MGSMRFSFHGSSRSGLAAPRPALQGVAVVGVVVAALVLGGRIAAHGAGFVTGFGQFNKIADNPSAGRQQLYEWDLFLSPTGNTGYVGQPRRLGAPPGQTPTYDGYYRIDSVPAGVYSIYVNQPDFFASPKLVPNVVVRDGVGTFVNVDLDVDYSTYFSASNEWTNWDSMYYQTFTARGTGVRGVSWKMAGWGLYGGKTGHITILEDNGNPNPARWRLIGSASDSALGSDSDEWVRFHAAQVPLVPGKRYAVGISVDGGLAIYKRNKDADSYQGGRAYDSSGNPRDFDLNATVFVDTEETIVTHTRKSSGPGVFSDGLFDQRWGQSFVAQGTSLAAVDLFAAGAAGFNVQWSVREGNPTGRLISPNKTVGSAYFASSTALAGVSFNPDEVPLVPGRTYYIEAQNPVGFHPYTMETRHPFADGMAYREGSAAPNLDLSMTIMEYHQPKSPLGIAFTNFDEPALGAVDYTRRPGGVELGFHTDWTATGQAPNVTVGKTTTTGTPSSPVLSHRTVAAATTFESVDLREWDDVSVSLMLQVGNTGYEDDDFLKVYVSDGSQQVSLLSLVGSQALNSRAGDGYLFYSANVPDAWTQARLVIDSRGNSGSGAERFDFDNVQFVGMKAVPEPNALVLAACGLAALLLFARQGLLALLAIFVLRSR